MIIVDDNVPSDSENGYCIAHILNETLLIVCPDFELYLETWLVIDFSENEKIKAHVSQV